MPRWEQPCGPRRCWPRSDQQQLPLRLLRRHLRTRVAHIHVDLTPNAEAARKVDARFNREADAGDQLAIVLGLEVVDVRAGAVELAIDGMTGAMHEVVAEPGRANDAARGIVDRGAGQGLCV